MVSHSKQRFALKRGAHIAMVGMVLRSVGIGTEIKKALVHSHAIPRLTFTSPHFERQTTVILPVATFLQKAKLGHFITSEVRVEGEEPPKIWLEFQTIIYLSHVRPLAGAPRHIVFMDLPRYHACLPFPLSSTSLKCPKRRNYAAICHSRKPNLQQGMMETSRRVEKPNKQFVTLFLEEVPPCSRPT